MAIEPFWQALGQRMKLRSANACGLEMSDFALSELTARGYRVRND
jgi:hypothetical protein